MVNHRYLARLTWAGLANENAVNRVLRSRSHFVKNVDNKIGRWGTVDAPGEARPMNFLKRSPAIVCAADIAMAERLRAVSSRGKLETDVYENWQPSQSGAPTRRGAATVEA
jgi:hypothetical protein